MNILSISATNYDYKSLREDVAFQESVDALKTMLRR